MSELQSLAEIKAENAAEEKAAANKVALENGEDDFEETEEDAQDPEKDQPTAEETNPDDEDDEEGDEKESWMKGDDDSSLDSEFAKVRRKVTRKFQGRLDQAEDEAEQLRKELEQLKKGKPATQQKLPEKPSRGRYRSEEDYIEALTDWKLDVRDAQKSSNQIANEHKAKQEESDRETMDRVETHYERAAKLSEEAGITPEKYQMADRRVRAAVEAKFPDAGDAIVDKLIAVNGSGSERVFYNLGVNKARLDEFVDTLGRDAGLATANFLGRLSEQIGTPRKRTSSAPEPVSSVSGDKRGGNMTALQRKYKEAMKSGDSQKAWDIKRSAKKKGTNTNSW